MWGVAMEADHRHGLLNPEIGPKSMFYRNLRWSEGAQNGPKAKFSEANAFDFCNRQAASSILELYCWDSIGSVPTTVSRSLF